MGVKKPLFEQQVLGSLGGTLLKVASDIVQSASGRNLDDAYQGLISRLQRGTKDIIDKQGNKTPTPLTEEDYIRIFNDLKKVGTDLSITRILDKTTSEISELIRTESIPKLLNSESVINAIKDGVNNPKLDEDLVADRLTAVIQKRYGNYADDIAMTDFMEGVRKIYNRLKGTVDDLAPVVDNVVNPPSSVSYDTIPDGAFDEANQIVTDASRFNISRTLSDLNPNLYRKLTQMVKGFFEYFGDGKTVRNRILDNLMAIERGVLADGTKVDDVISIKLKGNIKDDLDKLRQINSDYIELVREAISIGKKTNLPATVNGKELPAKEVRKIWTEMERILKEVEQKYGKPGFFLVSSPNTGSFLFLKEAFIHANAVPINIGKFISNKWFREKKWFEFLRAVREMNYEPKPIDYITTPLKGLSRFFQQAIAPGSARGIPRGMKQDADLNTIPGAYDKIQNHYKKFPRLVAWASLFSEKVILLTEIAVVTNIISGVKELWRFWDSEKEEIQKKYGNCVFEVADWMRENDVTLNKNVEKFSGETVPSCFYTFISTADDMEVQNFLVRSEFFRKGFFGIQGTEYLDALFVRDSLNEIGLDTLPKLVTGQLLNVAISIWEKYMEPEYFSERTGETTRLEAELARLRSRLSEVNGQIQQEVREIDISEINLPNMPNSTNITNNSGNEQDF